MNLYHRKVEELNLWDYSNIWDVQVLELNGFVLFKLDSRVFFTKLPLVTVKIFYLLFEVFEQF